MLFTQVVIKAIKLISQWHLFNLQNITRYDSIAYVLKVLYCIEGVYYVLYCIQQLQKQLNQQDFTKNQLFIAKP